MEFDHKPITRKPTPELDNLFDLIKADSYTWTVTDFDKINDLLLSLIQMQREYNVDWKINEKNYEDCNRKAFKHYKQTKREDGKPVNDLQATNLAKYEANKRYLDNQSEEDFWFVKSMIGFIEGKLTQMGVTNKDQRELEHNLYRNNKD